MWRASMKILPEKVFVHPDRAKRELIVVMEGFRITVNAEEAEALRDALIYGLKHVSTGPTEARARTTSRNAVLQA
jgi:hypothetical protein